MLVVIPTLLFQLTFTLALTWQNDVRVQQVDEFFEVVDLQTKGNALYSVGNRVDLTAAILEYSELQALSTSSLGHQDATKEGLTIIATSMSIDKSTGNIFIAGYSDFVGRDANADFMMACLDQTGRVVWYYNFGTGQDDLLNGVAVSGDGHVYFAGTVGGTLDGIKFKGGTDIILFKYDVNGTKVWSQTYGGVGYEMAWGATMGKTPDDVYIAGFVGFTNGFVQRYNSNGVLVWHDQLVQTSSFSGITYDHTNDELYVTGYLFGMIDQHVSNMVDAAILKWKATGSRIPWSVLIGGQDVEFGFDLVLNPQSGVLYVGGTTYGSIDDLQHSSGGMDVFVSKVYYNGTVAWTLQGGTQREDVIGSITMTDYESLYVGGIWDQEHGFIAKLTKESLTSQQSIQAVVTGSPAVAIVLILLAAGIVAGYAYYRYGDRPFQYALGRRIRLDMPWSNNRRIRLDDVYDVDTNEENQILVK